MMSSRSDSKMERTASPRPPRHRRPGFWLSVTALVLVLVGLERHNGWFSSLLAALDVARLEALLTAAGPLAPLTYTIAMALAVVSPLPTVPLDLLAGRFFGPWFGTLYSVVGATAGSLVSFEIARRLGRELVARWLKGHIQFCEECSDRLLGKLVFMGRLVPIAPFDLLSFGAGLTRMSRRRFALASLLGMVPLTFVYNSAGNLVLGSRWLGWLGGGLMIVAFFYLPYAIERYDWFSMRRHFRHGPAGGDAGVEGGDALPLDAAEAESDPVSPP